MSKHIHPMDRMNQGQLRPVKPSLNQGRVKLKQCTSCGRIFVNWKKCHGVNVCPHCNHAEV